ncbi:MAG TPA: twin-arginine translocase TatA/TatE family subunit [Dehalococcoidia bacterium]|jgi:sec-independent protein translocase protein TatA
MGGLFDNPLHLMLLVVVIVLVFGASKLGDVGGALGKSIREFKREASRDEEGNSARRVEQAPPPVAPTAGYVAPQPPTVAPTTPQPVAPAYVPPAQTPPPPAAAGYQAAEPQRRMEYAPTEYRPATPPQAPSASNNGTTPEYRGG